MAPTQRAATIEESQPPSSGSSSGSGARIRQSAAAQERGEHSGLHERRPRRVMRRPDAYSTLTDSSDNQRRRRGQRDDAWRGAGDGWHGRVGGQITGLAMS